MCTNSLINLYTPLTLCRVQRLGPSDTVPVYVLLYLYYWVKAKNISHVTGARF